MRLSNALAIGRSVLKGRLDGAGQLSLNLRLPEKVIL